MRSCTTAGYDQSFTFSYNPAGQIVSRSGSNDSYAWTGHYNLSRGYPANGLNQYTASGSASPTYDSNGNLASDGTTSFAHDAENHLVGASGGHSATLAYDPLGRLWQLTSGSATTQFVDDGGVILDELTTGGTYLRRFAHGAGTDEPVGWYEGVNAARAPLTDERGTAIAFADSSGNGVAIDTYDEYGIPRSSNLGRFQYTGQAWLPELGLFYYKARFYSPTMGRFMQTDPIGYNGGMNPYNYVGSDPINFTDPLGLYPVCRSVDASHWEGEKWVVTGVTECEDNGDNGLRYLAALGIAATLKGPHQIEPQYTVIDNLAQPVTPDTTCSTPSPDGRETQTNIISLAAYGGGIPMHIHGQREPIPGADDGYTTHNPTNTALVGTSTGLWEVKRNGPSDYSIGLVFSFDGSPIPVDAISALINKWNAHDGKSGDELVYKSKGTKCHAVTK